MNPNRNYLVLSGVTGTVPGTLLPKGLATLPLNWDVFTDIVLGMVNTPAFDAFMGKLDGQGNAGFETGVPFLDHMLDQVARHGMLDLDIRASGDLHIDAHHTVEDIGITLGQAMSQAVADKRGIRRYGHAYVPLDEALSRVVIDFSGRPGLEYAVEYPRARVGEFDIDLLH